MMFGAVALPLLFETSAAVVVAVTTAVATLTAPNPTLPLAAGITTAEATATAPSPDVVGLLQPPVAQATLTALDPALPDTGLINVSVAQATATAPNPAVLFNTRLLVTTAAGSLAAPDPNVDYGFVVSEETPRYLGVPQDSTNERQHRIDLARVINRTLQGKLNATGKMTLVADADSTVLRDERLTPFSAVLLDPMTATAAAEIVYADETNRQNGQWVFTHTNNSEDDRTFRFTVIG